MKNWLKNWSGFSIKSAKKLKTDGMDEFERYLAISGEVDKLSKEQLIEKAVLLIFEKILKDKEYSNIFFRKGVHNLKSDECWFQIRYEEKNKEKRDEQYIYIVTLEKGNFMKDGAPHFYQVNLNITWFNGKAGTWEEPIEEETYLRLKERIQKIKDYINRGKEREDYRMLKSFVIDNYEK